MLISARAMEAGVPRDQLSAEVMAGSLVRLRRGVLVDAELWTSTPPWGRHAIRARGVAAVWSSEESATHALSHHSALALHGVPFHGVDDRVHVVRVDGGRAMNGGMMAGHPAVGREWATRIEGVPVVRAALAVAQVASAFGLEAGLVSADAALHAGVLTDSELAQACALDGLGRRAHAPGLVHRFADGRRESPGETRAWCLFRTIGLPEPELQVDVFADNGEFLGRPDYLWREAGVFGEFDGALKYEDSAVLRAEKSRQDRFADHGWEAFRLGWGDLERPRTVADRAHRAFARARARRHPLSG